MTGMIAMQADIALQHVAWEDMADQLPDRCSRCQVRETSLCSSLCDDELATLNSIGRRKIVPKGAVVSWEGDDNGMCANIVSGALKLLKTTSDGREQAVGLLFEGDFVGQPFTDTSELTAVALSDTDICQYPRRQFERVMAEKPKLERALLQRTMRSLNEARDRQLTLARKGARARIAGFLVDLSRGGARDIELPMSRGDIADYLGLTIETVSRQFTDLRAKGLIDAEKGGRRVKLIDVASLQSLSDE
nr:Crp/Fnr family transcriptional regulator [uncultured Sphingomonas sp.]